MNYKEKARAVNSGKSPNNSVGNRDESSLVDAREYPPGRVRLSERAEVGICEITHKFGTGQLELWQLPPSLYSFFLVAWFAGRESRDAEVSRLNYEADLWFWCHTNRKGPDSFRRWQTSELWRQASSGATS